MKPNRRSAGRRGALRPAVSPPALGVALALAAALAGGGCQQTPAPPKPQAPAPTMATEDQLSSLRGMMPGAPVGRVERADSADPTFVVLADVKPADFPEGTLVSFLAFSDGEFRPINHGRVASLATDHEVIVHVGGDPAAVRVPTVGDFAVHAARVPTK